MSAWTWIQHSEMNASKTEEAKLFQIWLETREQNIQPKYNQKLFLSSGRINKWQLLAGPNDSKDSLQIMQDAYIYRSYLKKENSLEYKKHKSENLIFIMVIKWLLSVMGSKVDSRDSIELSDEDNIEILAKNKTDFILIEIPK